MPALTLTRWAPVVLMAASLSWASTLIAVPFAVSHASASRQATRIAAAAYFVGSFICHQRPERSFHPWGVQVPVCARCEGIYLAAPFAMVFVLAAHRRRRRELHSRAMWRWILVLGGLPTAMTLLWEWTMGVVPADAVRAVAGVVLGASVAAFAAAVVAGDLR